MAKPQDLQSIKLLIESEEGQKNTPGADSVTETKDAQAEKKTPDGESVTEAQKAPEEDPKEKKRRKRKNNKSGEMKGISSESPVVRLLEDEKRCLKRLEAHILLETGETVSDHQLIMAAVREYAKKHHPDFQ